MSNYKISCSFGEIIDKISILMIKKKKCTNHEQSQNIEHELTTLTQENPLSNTHDELFDKLKQVNKILWELEDKIRDKSKNKQFDNTYIHIAELIHKNNDLRAKIKYEINTKYRSSIIEEKIYSE